MGIVISLFDFTGTMVIPWRDAGYMCWTLDIQHPRNGGSGEAILEDGIYKLHHDLSRPWLCPYPREEIAAVFAFPPCDHLAVSGARWFKGKGLRALAKAIDLFASAAEFCEWSGAPYLIENPVSSISSYWRKPDYVFHPWQFSRYHASDNYTKKTCLWVGGGFVMPRLELHPKSPPDDRIHKAAPGEGRKNYRSATPLGFARAVFEENSGRVVA